MRFLVDQLLEDRLKVQKLLSDCCIGETVGFVYFEQFRNPDRLVRRFQLAITPAVKATIPWHAQKIVTDFVGYAENELGRRYCRGCVWCDKTNGFL